MTVVLAARAASSVEAASIVAVPAPIVIASAVANLVASSAAPVTVVTLRVNDEATADKSWLVKVEAFKVVPAFRFMLLTAVTMAAITSSVVPLTV